MDEKAFIMGIVELYHKARNVKFEDKKLRRGRSHSISSYAEDFFAKYLCEKIICDRIYIDQPISVIGFHSQAYPDIVIIRGNEILSFCDLKMDMGWHRDSLYALCEEKYNWVQTVSGKDCKIRDGLEKTDTFYKISNNASFNIVIVSDQNINPEKLKIQMQKALKFSPHVEIFVLSFGEHPNTYGINTEALMNKIQIEEKEFTKLIDKLDR